MRAAHDRLVALAASGRRLSETTSLDRLFSLAADLGLDVLEASSASLARVAHERGVLQVLRNAGERSRSPAAHPDEQQDEISDFRLLDEVGDARPWIGRLGDPDMSPADRELLSRSGMTSSISLPIIVHGRLWGELSATRRAGLPAFGDTDVAAGEAYCGLLSAALARIAERDELLNLAYRDPLTGLGNRRAVDDHLEELLSTVWGPGSVAVVLCDVNGLKRVNDTYGHEAGDRLLRQVAGMLTKMASTVPGCFAARLGGDEFCLLIENITEIDLQRLTERMTDEAARLHLGAGLSCGWARTSRREDGVTASAAARALLRLADAAQYRAKRSGREVQGVDALVGVLPLDPGSVGAAIVAESLDRLEGSGGGVEQRLEVVATAVAGAIDAAGWCVSVSIDRGPVVIVRNADVRCVAGRESAAFRPGAAFDLNDYPATSAALRGGTFHATLTSGHASEREFLAVHGYDEIIGAGVQLDRRHSWLVEILGDAASSPLGPHLGLLRALVAVAVADHESSPVPQWAGIDDRDSTAC